MRFIACGTSVAGPRHLELGEQNQDSMVLVGCRGGWIAAVADGLGSRPHSDVGSKSACQVSRQALRATSGCLDLTVKLPMIHQQWLKAIKPFTPRDAATTLLFSHVTADGDVHAAQLGDGVLLMKCAGVFQRVTPNREAFGNQTLSLGVNHEQKKWTISQGTLSEPGDGVVLMTDGISDDLEPAQLVEFFDALYRTLSVRSRRRGKRWLQAELNDWATPLHSDDKTIVAIFRTSK